MLVPRYVCSATSGVSDAIGLYQKAFSGDAAYAPPPLPAYLTGNEDESLAALDTCFLLLQLFQDKSSVKMEKILAPVSHTPLPLDSRLRYGGGRMLRQEEVSAICLSICFQCVVGPAMAVVGLSLVQPRCAIPTFLIPFQSISQFMSCIPSAVGFCRRRCDPCLTRICHRAPWRNSISTLPPCSNPWGCGIGPFLCCSTTPSPELEITPSKNCCPGLDFNSVDHVFVFLI